MIFVSLLFQLFDCYCGCILIPGGAWVLIDLKTCLKAQQGSQVFASKNQILFVFVSLSSCLFFFNVCARLYQCVICTLCISLSVSLFLSTVNKKLDGIVTWNIYIYIFHVPKIDIRAQAKCTKRQEQGYFRLFQAFTARNVLVIRRPQMFSSADESLKDETHLLLF